VFTDPFDGAEVRWHPVSKKDVQVESEGLKVMVGLPTGDAEAGQYPVDDRKLTNMVAPCLVHMLDGFYSSLVMERLVASGVTTFVGIHDCWLVPRGSEVVLREAMGGAAVEWFRGLGPVYNALHGYLSGSRYEGLVSRARAKWEVRVARGAWPRFLAPPSLSSPTIEHPSSSYPFGTNYD
jgi:hypothetical protein